MTRLPDETDADRVLEMRPYVAAGGSLVAGYADEPGDPKRKRFTIQASPYRWREASQIPPRDWLYGRHYVRRFVTATVAPGGLGKTTLALVEAVAMASGKPLLGQPVRAPFRVWYWNGEDPIDEIERRVAAICLHYEIAEADLGGRLFFDSGRWAPIKIGEMYRSAPIVKYAVVDGLAREIRARAIDAMIVDPFVSCHAVPENDNGAIDLVVKGGWGAVADRTGAAVELVHHARKPAGSAHSEFSADDARGASALIGGTRSVRVLNGMSRDEAGRFEIAEEHRRSHIRVTHDKTNMHSHAGGALWCKLVSVPLGNENGNMPQDLVGVAVPWSPPNVADTVQPDDLDKVLSAITGKPWAHNVQANNWAGHAIGEALGFDSHTDQGRTRAKNLLAMWVGSGALRVQAEHDPAKGRTRPMVVGGRTE
jgi:hypothetical protein